jgi:hypothetical protein
LRALNAGHVIQISEAHTYKMADLFSHWVRYWYDRKLAAKAKGEAARGELEFINLILKSLSGKFGQRGEYWLDRPDVCPRGRWGHWMRTPHYAGEAPLWRAVAGTAQCKTPGAEPADAYPIISAYITSHAREYMRGIFKSMPPRSVLYTATDSIITTEAGYNHLLSSDLIHPTAIGLFKLLDRAMDCEIHGPNWYRVGDRSCRSGLYKKAKFLGPVGMVAECWQQLAGILGSKPDGSVLVRQVKLKPSTITQKGTVGSDGWVTPLWVPDNEELDWQWPKRRSPRERHQ